MRNIINYFRGSPAKKDMMSIQDRANASPVHHHEQQEAKKSFNQMMAAAILPEKIAARKKQPQELELLLDKLTQYYQLYQQNDLPGQNLQQISSDIAAIKKLISDNPSFQLPQELQKQFAQLSKIMETYTQLTNGNLSTYSHENTTALETVAGFLARPECQLLNGLKTLEFTSAPEIKLEEDSQDSQELPPYLDTESSSNSSSPTTPGGPIPMTVSHSGEKDFNISLEIKRPEHDQGLNQGLDVFFEHVDMVVIRDCKFTREFAHTIIQSRKRNQRRVNFELRLINIEFEANVYDYLCEQYSEITITIIQLGQNAPPGGSPLAPNSLEIIGSDLSVQKFKQLQASDEGKTVSKLIFTHNAFRITTQLANSQITELCIQLSEIAAELVYTLRNAFAGLPQLEILRLDRVKFLSNAKQQFLTKITEQQQLKVLELRDCQLDDSDLPVLLKYLKQNAKLEIIDLSNNKFSQGGWGELAQAIHHNNRQRQKNYISNLRKVHHQNQKSPLQPPRFLKVIFNYENYRKIYSETRTTLGQLALPSSRKALKDISGGAIGIYQLFCAANVDDHNSANVTQDKKHIISIAEKFIIQFKTEKFEIMHQQYDKVLQLLRCLLPNEFPCAQLYENIILGNLYSRALEDSESNNLQSSNLHKEKILKKMQVFSQKIFSWNSLGSSRLTTLKKAIDKKNISLEELKTHLDTYLNSPSEGNRYNVALFTQLNNELKTMQSDLNAAIKSHQQTQSAFGIAISPKSYSVWRQQQNSAVFKRAQQTKTRVDPSPRSPDSQNMVFNLEI